MTNVSLCNCGLEAFALHCVSALIYAPVAVAGILHETVIINHEIMV
jgi:hypothetical protein